MAGAVRIFVAGASGIIGARLVPLLVAEGHVVAGMTRSASKAGLLAGLGAEPVVADVFDPGALTQAVVSFAPEVVFHQLTDLPDKASEIAAFGDRNDRMRSEGTRNLLAAAAAARAARVIAQSISWELPSAARRAVTAAHERAVLEAGGVVIRYGQLYGPGTYYPGAPPGPPRIHVDDAARQTLPALTAYPGVTLVVDDRAAGDRKDQP
ncbi:MAG TPA: NAD-dependent epimerase/dehydratase family protein [Streptosporangiaceae bacterium]|nr:NAD-dependent epimerase/dehydratase family protein [Streptosporangiaceae bacterium]